jgi:hypothetical protein
VTVLRGDSKRAWGDVTVFVSVLCIGAAFLVTDGDDTDKEVGIASHRGKPNLADAIYWLF